MCDVLYEKSSSSEGLQNDLDEIKAGIGRESVSDMELNEWVDMVAFKEAILGYHQNFDNITFEEGIDLGMGGDPQPAFWSGSVWPTENATSAPNNIRIYGTWRAVHTESGKVVYNKWYGLMFFNEAGKVVRFTDWFDVNGMQVQINAE